MNRVVSLFMLLSSLSFTFAQEATSASSPNVIIGCYNIQIFGMTKVERPNIMNVLAQIALTYDVLAVEEVGSNDSSASDETCVAVMDAYLARINDLAGAGTYAYVPGNQYAIVYKVSEFSVVSSGLYSGSESFTYTPLTAYLKSTTGNLDFSMLVIHTSPSKAKAEIPALKNAMAEVATLYAEPDVICLGDYNGDGSYYDEGSGLDLAGFPSPTYITAIPNSADTTIVASSNTYDRIELSESMTSDYTGKWGVVDPSKMSDVQTLEGTKTTAGTEEALSDHLPVWCMLYSNQDTD